MAATALLKFSQGVTIGNDGEAFIGDLSGPFTAENSDNTGVASWRLELLYAESGSSYTPTPTAPILLAQNANNGVPTMTLPPDTEGCYRIRLSVWDQPNFLGNVDRDIRNFGVPLPNTGVILPPFQMFPGELDNKPNELNFGNQKWGWAGTTTHKMMNEALRTLDNSIGGTISNGQIAVGVSVNQIDGGPDLTYTRPGPTTPVLTIGRTSDTITGVNVVGAVGSIQFLDSSLSVMGLIQSNITGSIFSSLSGPLQIAGAGYVYVSGWHFPDGGDIATVPSTNSVGLLSNNGAGVLSWQKTGNTIVATTTGTTYTIDSSSYGDLDPSRSLFILVLQGTGTTSRDITLANAVAGQRIQIIKESTTAFAVRVRNATASSSMYGTSITSFTQLIGATTVRTQAGIVCTTGTPPTYYITNNLGAVFNEASALIDDMAAIAGSAIPCNPLTTSARMQQLVLPNYSIIARAGTTSITAVSAGAASRVLLRPASGDIGFAQVTDAECLFSNTTASAGNPRTTVAPQQARQNTGINTGTSTNADFTLTDNGWYEFTVHCLAKRQTTLDYRRATATISAIRNAGTLTIQGVQNDLAGVGSGLVITLSATGGSLRVNIANTTGETIVTHTSVGYFLQDLF